MMKKTVKCFRFENGKKISVSNRLLTTVEPILSCETDFSS